MRRPRRILYLVMMLLGFGCSQLPKASSITVAGLVFFNTSRTPIHNATLRVSNTHGLIACGIILPGKECSTTFPQRDYRGNPIIVTWEQEGQSWSTGEVNIQLPSQSATGEPNIAIVSLGDQGKINVRLVPQTSSHPTAVDLQPRLR